MKYLKHMKLICVLSVAIVLASCGSSGLEGTYTDVEGAGTITFQSNGKVIVNNLGDVMEANYELEGNKVTINKEGERSEIMTLEEDGSMSGLGTKFVKKK